MLSEEKVREAIEALKEVHDYYDVMCGDWSFCWTAVEALKKQLMSEPLNIAQAHDWAEVTGRCRECHKPIRNVWKYCPNCGQRIDWGTETLSEELASEILYEKLCTYCVKAVECHEECTYCDEYLEQEEKLLGKRKDD